MHVKVSFHPSAAIFWQLLNWFQLLIEFTLGCASVCFFNSLKLFQLYSVTAGSLRFWLINSVATGLSTFFPFLPYPGKLLFFFLIFFWQNWSNLGLQMMSWWFLCFPDVLVSCRPLINIFHRTHLALSVFWPLCMKPFTASFFCSPNLSEIVGRIWYCVSI